MTEELASHDNDTIKNYKVDGPLIHINYVGGKTGVMEHYECNIDKLNQLMVDEAKIIIKAKTGAQYLSKRNIAILDYCIASVSMAIVASMSVEVGFGTVDLRRVAVEAIVTAAIPLIIYATMKSNNKYEDKEIKKYKIFIEHYNEFVENQYNEALYNGIHKKGYIGINNLDGYTYEEVERMCQNLQNVRKRDK